VHYAYTNCRTPSRSAIGPRNGYARYRSGSVSRRPRAVVSSTGRKQIENEMMDGYMMDHSTFMYLMSPDDELITVYPTEDTAENIAKDIRNRLITG